MISRRTSFALAALAAAALAARPGGAAPAKAAAASAAPAKGATPAEKKAYAAAAAVAHEQLKSCDQRTLSGGYLFQCDRLVALVVEKPASTSDLLDEVLAMVHGLGGSMALSDVTIAVGERKLPGVSFDLGSEEKGREHVVGKLFAEDLGKGLGRAVSCFSSKPTETSDYQCAKLFSALGTVGTAPFDQPHKGALEPAFLGRKIAVPETCKAISADASTFRVECQDGASVFYSRTRSLLAAEKIAKEFHENFLRTGTAAPDRPCILGGTPVTCQVVDNQTQTFYLATAKVGADSVVAVCYQQPQLVVAHPVCADIFSF